ncbi:MAG: methyltransferase domain-containing protein [Myxococcales bacterium]|nr:methyltransferase domain-containing protein [Myxococcales bacterium]
MRRRHFDALRPLCPNCRSQGVESALRIGAVARERGSLVLEGALHCSRAGCQAEYPIIDGVPILVAGVRAFITDNLLYLLARDDLSSHAESMLGDGSGPGSAFNTTRQFLSSYAWDHYADLDPQEPASEPRPGAVIRTLDRGLELLGGVPEGPAIEIGCSVGRTSFEMAARHRGLVLGVDVNVSMIRLAARVLVEGEVRYPRRQVGIVFERRTLPARFPDADRVDFWIADALALPFADATFALAVSLNVLDCVPAPYAFLGEIARVLAGGGGAVLSTPYDWSPGATPVEAWIGGHSQRGPNRGAAEPFVRSLLDGTHPQAVPGLRLVGEDADSPWHVRLHARSTMLYRNHLLALRAGRA